MKPSRLSAIEVSGQTIAVQCRRCCPSAAIATVPARFRTDPASLSPSVISGFARRTFRLSLRRFFRLSAKPSKVDFMHNDAPHPTPRDGHSEADLADRLQQSEESLEARFGDIAVLGAEIARMDAEAVRKDQELDRLTSLQHKMRTAQAIRSPTHAEMAISELSRQLAIRDSTLADVMADRDRAVAMVETLVTSTSWKVTGPLRRIRKALRRADRS